MIHEEVLYRVYLFTFMFFYENDPLPFGRICFVVLVMRKRGESS